MADPLIGISDSLSGSPLIGSPLTPRGELVRVGHHIYFHRHIWYSARKRKPHGRTNGPRKWKFEKRICDDGFLDKIRAATENVS